MMYHIWVLRFRDLGVFVFELSVLRFRSRGLRFRVLGSSCFGLRFRVLRFRNYLGSTDPPKEKGRKFAPTAPIASKFRLGNTR